MTTERATDDYYATPREVIRALRPYLPLSLGNVIDPAAGDNRFCDELGHMATCWWSGDVTPRSRTVNRADFFEQSLFTGVDTIITNPPFNQIERFILHAMTFCPQRVIFLARLGLLASQGRYERIWSRYPVRQVVILSARPSFIGQGTDNSEYAWFLWGAVPGQGIAWVPAEATRPSRQRGEAVTV